MSVQPNSNWIIDKTELDKCNYNLLYSGELNIEKVLSKTASISWCALLAQISDKLNFLSHERKSGFKIQLFVKISEKVGYIKKLLSAKRLKSENTSGPESLSVA